MPLTLRWRTGDTPPVEAEVLRADTLTTLTPTEVARLQLPVGNGGAELGELATIEGDGADGTLVIEGDLRRVARIGLGQGSGRLVIRGDVGPHLGAGLSGGTIELFGNAGPWAGAELRGGLLHIHGAAGDHAGSVDPGGRLGMREGVLLIEGDAGHEVGLGMRRGLIAVGGSLGAGAGRALIAGTLFGFGPVGPGVGAGMKRGSIVLAGGAGTSILPTFSPSGLDRPPFVSLYLKELQRFGFPVPTGAFAGSFERFNGDLATGGQGELLVHRPG